MQELGEGGVRVKASQPSSQVSRGARALSEGFVSAAARASVPTSLTLQPVEAHTFIKRIFTRCTQSFPGSQVSHFLSQHCSSGRQATAHAARRRGSWKRAKEFCDSKRANEDKAGGKEGRTGGKPLPQK